MNNLKPLAVGAVLFLLAVDAGAMIFYVNVGNSAPAAPFTAWATAATNIQDAIAVSSDGDLILVSNGVYMAGGSVIFGSLTNRVAVDRAVTLQSVNGPAKTFIQGNRTLGNNAVRCVYLANNSALVGFTITNGATRAAGDVFQEESGGGIWSASTSALVSNCVIVANSANFYGGGVFSGTLVNCTITNNLSGSRGGGALGGVLTNCVLAANNSPYGGGACSNVLVNCTLKGNWAAKTGGGTFSSTLTNCLLSRNSSTNGGGAIYGVLVGCTLTNNTAYNGGGTSSNVLTGCRLLNNVATNDGGGSFCANLTNCTLIQNSASHGGGGAAWGSSSGCRFTNNYAGTFGGGVFSNTAFNSVICSNWGGSFGSVLNSCWIVLNVGGGSHFDTLNNCLVQYNLNADGANGSTLVNCTVRNNGGLGGYYGARNCNVTNCIIYFNSPGGAGGNILNLPAGGVEYCCTYPPLSATCFTNNPLFLDGVHLQAGSPCINAGNSSLAPGNVDFDGRPRMVGGAVDVGATEFQGADVEPFIAWLFQFGLPNDGSADFADSDGDRMTNWQEWRAGTNPTDAQSVLQLASPAFTSGSAGVVVSWQSVSNVMYYLQRSYNLSGSFTSIQSNLVGQSGLTSFTDTTATHPSAVFYRVGVQ